MCNRSVLLRNYPIEISSNLELNVHSKLHQRLSALLKRPKCLMSSPSTIRCQAHSNPDYPTDTHSSTPRTSVPPQEVARHSGPSPSSLTTAESNVHQVCVQPRRKVLLQVLPVQIDSQGKLVNVYAILDPGNDSTLIKRDLADHLQLVGEAYQLNLSTVGNDVKTQRLDRVSFGISSKDH